MLLLFYSDLGAKQTITTDWDHLNTVCKRKQWKRIMKMFVEHHNCCQWPEIKVHACLSGSPMGANPLCLRVSTSRSPTAASSRRTPTSRWSVKASSAHTDGRCKLGYFACEVLERAHSPMLSLSPGGLGGAGGQQRVQAVRQWVLRNVFKSVLYTEVAFWANCKAAAVVIRVFVLKCLTLCTWTRWWATWTCGGAILSPSWGSAAWTRSLRHSPTTRRCLCSSWRASSSSTTGISGSVESSVQQLCFQQLF